MFHSSETSVQGTNDDAQVSKLSCAKVGYFRDDFIHFFVRKASRRSPLINRGYYSRHAALRQLLLSFLSAAASRGLPCQVLCLGAGFDTTWFQLQQDHPELLPARYLEVDFKEVTKRKAAIINSQPQLRDSVLSAGGGAATAAAAAAAVASQPGPQSEQQRGQQEAAASALGQQHPHGQQESATSTGQQQSLLFQGHQESAAATESPAEGPGGAAAAAAAAPSLPLSSHAPSGSMPPPPPFAPPAAMAPPAPAATASTSASTGATIDPASGQILSPRYSLLPVDLKDCTALGEAVQRAGLEPGIMTYILSECVLVYMEPEDSSAVIRWLAAKFPTAELVVYEQVKPNDAFGRQMCSNLESRGCPLRGVHATPTLEAHRRRMTDNGWAAAASLDMDTIYQRHLDSADKARAERLEMFDEFEEWHMIQEHYCITTAVNDALGVLEGVGFKTAGEAAAERGLKPVVD